MSTLKFRTNIQCSGCLAKVKPVLDAETQIDQWQVDLQSADRILSVDTTALTPADISHILDGVGFTGQVVSTEK